MKQIVGRKFKVILMSAFLLMGVLLSGCGQNEGRQSGSGSSGGQEAEVQEDGGPSDGDKISIVCTIFPQYDWVRQILGEQMEKVELTLLLDKQVDLHNYQPTVTDIVKISTCDLFIYTGGESDEWVADALKEAVNEDMVTLNLLAELGDGAKVEEILEGMEEEHSHDTAEADHEEGEESHSEEAEHDPDEEEEYGHETEETGEYDEHVWLSLKNAAVFCRVITTALAELDGENADVYEANLSAYREKLFVLDDKYREEVAKASVKTFVFGDRYPFRYLMEDYGLSCYAAFPGCSAETEASFETIAFLADKVDELKLNTIMVTESADQSIAQTVSDNTVQKNQRILVLDSMQTVAVDSGTSYLAIMESNLGVLQEAMETVGSEQ